MRTICSVAFALFLASCQTASSPLDQVVSQKYVHKYGFDVSEKEWEERAQEGQVITVLQNGVRVTRSYEKGELHGPTTYTFPDSDVVERLLVYNQGTLLKEATFDMTGMPVREEVYEFDGHTQVTVWDEKGVPLSIEEYEGTELLEGKYYTPEHELEAKVDEGIGERIKRDRSGLLLLRDRIENGAIASRTTYHPTGQAHTISHYRGYQLHGEQLKFTTTGKPLMRLFWDHGVLDGVKTVYRNGVKIAEVPYIKGQKHGIELHFDDLGNLTAEIPWRNDKKHGCTKYYTDEETETEWHHAGQSVTAQKFELLEMREKIIADFNAAAEG